MAERTTSSPSTGSGTKSSTGDTTSRPASGREESPSGIAQRVRESAVAQLTTQKDRATDGLGTVAAAVRHSTTQLREQQHDTVARYVEQAANQIDRFTDVLRKKDVQQLMQDAQRLARRQPALFIGSAFALGLVVARFLKSSPPDDARTAAGDQYESKRYATRRAYSGMVPSSAIAHDSAPRATGASTPSADLDQVTTRPSPSTQSATASSTKPRRQNPESERS